MAPHPPAALVNLLKVFADGDTQARLGLSCLAPAYRATFSDALEAAARSTTVGGEAFRAAAAIGMLTRVIWSLVPPRLIESASPDFRALADRALADRYDQFPGRDDAARALTIVFKRIRQYATSGRRATSLDLGSPMHRGLLDQQHGRCNVCAYEFMADDIYYAAEEDGIPVGSNDGVDGELLLRQMYRRPELDHIIPLIFGGDGPENWQILCRSCNLGKSDHVHFMFAFSGSNAERYGYLDQLRAGTRYAVIVEALTKSEATPVPDDKKWFRVFKRSPGGLANIENLYAKYC